MMPLMETVSLQPNDPRRQADQRVKAQDEAKGEDNVAQHSSSEVDKARRDKLTTILWCNDAHVVTIFF